MHIFDVGKKNPAINITVFKTDSLIHYMLLLNVHLSKKFVKFVKLSITKTQAQLPPFRIKTIVDAFFFVWIDLLRRAVDAVTFGKVMR